MIYDNDEPFNRLNCPRCKHQQMKIVGSIKIMSTNLDKGHCINCGYFFILSKESSMFMASTEIKLIEIIDDINHFSNNRRK